MIETLKKLVMLVAMVVACQTVFAQSKAAIRYDREAGDYARSEMLQWKPEESLEQGRRVKRIAGKLWVASGNRKPTPIVLVPRKGFDSTFPSPMLSLPGGVVLADARFTAELTDDELSFALGHELAHYLNDDSLRLTDYVLAKRAREPRSLSETLARIKVAKATDPGFTQLVKATELDADLVGYKLALKAGFQPKPRDLFGKLLALGLAFEDTDHPSMVQRIARLEKRD